MASSKVCFSSMLEDNNDGGESSMRVMHPLTPEPLEQGMLYFWHMEWGKEKKKIMFFGTYVFFWYTLKEWRERLLKLTLN